MNAGAILLFTIRPDLRAWEDSSTSSKREQTHTQLPVKEAVPTEHGCTSTSSSKRPCCNVPRMSCYEDFSHAAQSFVLYSHFCNESSVFHAIVCNFSKRIINIYAHYSCLIALLSMKNALKSFFYGKGLKCHAAHFVSYPFCQDTSALECQQE